MREWIFLDELLNDELSFFSGVFGGVISVFGGEE